jgi:hypothetical protein
VNFPAARAWSSAVAPGQRAGLAQQRLQVMVQLEAELAPGGQPLMPGDLDAAIEDHQLRSVQVHPTGRPIHHDGAALWACQARQEWASRREICGLLYVWLLRALLEIPDTRCGEPPARTAR